MDPDKVFKFLVDNLADWSRVTVLTLVRPVMRFRTVPVESGNSSSIIGEYNSEKEFWLNPQLLAFALLSIVLGLAINALIPDRKPGPGLLASVIIILTYWSVYGSVLHGICLLLRGKGRYLETLSVTLQVLSTMYVVTSFLSLFAATLLTLPQLDRWVRAVPVIGKLSLEEPILVFFVIGTALLMIYVPLAMRSVHKFGWIRTVVLMLIPPLTVWVPIAIYQKTGLLPSISNSLGDFA